MCVIKKLTRFPENMITLKSRKFFQFLINTISIAGFCFQCLLICGKYFKYTTITAVRVVNALPVTNLPQVAFCNTLVASEGMSYIDKFQQHFKELVGDKTRNTRLDMTDPRLEYAGIRLGNNVKWYGLGRGTSEIVTMKRFVQDGEICFLLKTTHPSNFTASVLFFNPASALFYSSIDFKIPDVRNNSRKHDIEYGIYMTSYETDFNAPFLIPIIGKVHVDYGWFQASLSYSQKVTQLLPPPHDTNCRNYAREGLISQSSCNTRCLDEYTLKYGLIFSDHVFDRDLAISNSTGGRIKPILNYLKNETYESHEEYNMYLWYANWSKLCDEWRNIYYSDGSIRFDCTKPTSRKKWLAFLSERRDYYKFLADTNGGLKSRIKHCKMLCSQTDCETEYIIPYPIRMGQVNADPSGERFRTFQIYYRLYSPREPVVVVTSKEKLSLLDFVVYILSCLSFWFGFCPLSLSDSLGNLTNKFVIWKQATARFVSRERFNQLAQSFNSRLNSLAQNNAHLIRRLVQRMRNNRVTRVRPFNTRNTIRTRH